ncbi:SSI family serine proteinase inhibitor [Streptomyces sp. NPDC005863]|uniref:SSI family serine proteinase inhibitor n=1 Tax=unclassified Streptomyces TaxID=2593676 RepID=UPI0033D6405C
MLRRLALTAASVAVSVAALSGLPAAAQAGTPAAAPAPAPATAPVDRLTVTVTDSAGGGDGTYVLKCHPTGGNHPEAADACARLDEVTVFGTDPFAPVPRNAMCTMQYGGPATAHIRGTWAGRPVDARYSRTDGCQISRWNALVPVLPATSA